MREFDYDKFARETSALRISLIKLEMDAMKNFWISLEKRKFGLALFCYCTAWKASAMLSESRQIPV